MDSVSNWIIATVVAALIGVAGTYYYRNVRLRRDETEAGIHALSGASWRVFIHMVLDALSRRGFDRVVDREEASGDRDFVLEKDGRHWLLSCKHGSAYVLGKPAVNELANDIHLKAAAGGFLVTQGRITDDARHIAGLQGIELLDGPALWPELRGFIPTDQLAGIRANATDRARQGTALSWLLAIVVAIAVLVALPSSDSPRDDDTHAIVSAQDVPPDPAPPVPAGPTPSTVAAPDIPVPQQRQELANAISTLPDVDRAVWSSESTLQVYLLALDGDAFERICPLVERFDELASSRIQLTPPTGSEARVRFRQCRSY